MKDFPSSKEGLICQKNCEGLMVGVWEGPNLGSIPNNYMSFQKDPKLSIERRCSTILPARFISFGHDQDWWKEANRWLIFLHTYLYLVLFVFYYFRLQIWCQALQSLTTYLMLTTYSWMLCEGAYLRFILVFADYINTSRRFKIWLYIMAYCWWIFKLFEISNSYW